MALWHPFLLNNYPSRLSKHAFLSLLPPNVSDCKRSFLTNFLPSYMAVTLFSTNGPQCSQSLPLLAMTLTNPSSRSLCVLMMHLPHVNHQFIGYTNAGATFSCVWMVWRPLPLQWPLSPMKCFKRFLSRRLLTQVSLLTTKSPLRWWGESHGANVTAVAMAVVSNDIFQ